MSDAVTRDGRPWIPAYLDSIDAERCIGCGRCFKVCGRGVLAPGERDIGQDEDEDDDDEAAATMVMLVDDAGACIGCESCAKVCARNAPVHSAA